MILIFDLDDTLYEELSYVKSGMKAVSNYINNRFQIPALNSYKKMVNFLEVDGREKVFDKMLNDYRLNKKEYVNECLAIYRSHTPTISLYDSAKRCLDRFDHISKYLVSDGNKIVQKNKVDALALNKWMKRIILTHQYGLKYKKPSPHCFFVISKIEHSLTTNMVYIADNPRKDFVGIKPYGFKTIRVYTGNYKDETCDYSHEADLTINSLDEINIDLMKYLGINY